MKYELYADIWFLTNFTMDSIALLIAGKLMKQRIQMGRLLLGGVVGTGGSMVLFLGLKDYGWYQFGVHFLVNPLMIYLCYRSRKWKEFLGQWIITYLAFILLGGMMTWSVQIGKGRHFLFSLAGAFVFLALAGSILGHFKKRSETIYDLLLVTREGNISVKGFYDTGNLLMDPLVKQPVHIIKKEILWEQIQKEHLPVRLIPFHSLGQENGMLEAVTLEGMYILGKDRSIYLEKPVFGIAEEKLFQDDRCDVILNGKSVGP
ncbi:MAG: sigma-E processing peptidase SpoIIGA [Lachnospiraceae bacterium]|nr:sigma-E processing peptidase SpoIIGA [Lachnospiraceae bacterium]